MAVAPAPPQQDTRTFALTIETRRQVTSFTGVRLWLFLLGFVITVAILETLGIVAVALVMDTIEGSF